MMYYQNIVPYISHGILDGARLDEKLGDLEKLKLESDSLYRGEKGEDLSDVAPHLFAYHSASEVDDWLFGEGWGKSWGIYLVSRAMTEEVRKHFRQFLIVKDEEGRKLYFRFYDPRVLRVFLPTCTLQQLKELFGPIRYYLVEDEDPAKALLFSLENGALKKEILDLSRTTESPVRPAKAPAKTKEEGIV